jgi:hypothetical protein
MKGLRFDPDTGPPTMGEEKFVEEWEDLRRQEALDQGACCCHSWGPLPRQRQDPPYVFGRRSDP